MTNSTRTYRTESDARWRIAAAALLGAAATVGLGIYLARDQMRRNRRELFSAHPLRRLAALGYMKANPTADDLPVLRDYLAWEERPLLKRRAMAALRHLEEAVAGEQLLAGKEPLAGEMPLAEGSAS